MKPSFFYSTLSILALMSLIAVIAMIFMDKKPDPILLGVLTSVISAYLGSRIPREERIPDEVTTDDHIR